MLLCDRTRTGMLTVCVTVLRLNRSPTRAYEAAVGTRTTLRLASVTDAGFREGREHVVYEVHSRAQFEALTTFAGLFPAEPMHFLAPDFLSYAAAAAAAFPSLQFTAILLAVQ
eukprot:9069416-Pyramimonas_sp.AAC.2